MGDLLVDWFHWSFVLPIPAVTIDIYLDKRYSKNVIACWAPFIKVETLKCRYQKCISSRDFFFERVTHSSFLYGNYKNYRPTVSFTFKHPRLWGLIPNPFPSQPLLNIFF